jgi:hypothetical protein
MKIIEVEICNDDGVNHCPFFKRTEHYDYDDECLCMNTSEYGGKEIPQFKRRKDGGVGDYINGKFPKWCPLRSI